jgi:nucleotide-binding universal stress UspA family protein
MYDTILVPTDGSEGTAETLEHAIDAAKRRDATIHALSVVDRRVYLAAAGEQQDDVEDALREDAREAVEMVERTAGDAGVSVTTAIREGVPYRTILDYADEHGVDLVVMGTHGKTGRDKLASLGSVTERVVQNTDRPVLVVDIGDD